MPQLSSPVRQPRSQAELRKSLTAAFIACTLLLLTAAVALAAAAWANVGTAGFSAGEAQYTSLALDSQNTPYVAFRDMGNSGHATVMKYYGGNWVNVGTAGFSTNPAKYTSLALDSGGTPYVAYLDDFNLDKATVMKFGMAHFAR